MKITSALKKEFMYFSRTWRLFGVVFAIMIFALADPIMIKGMGLLMNSFIEIAEEQSEAAIAAGEEDDEDYDDPETAVVVTVTKAHDNSLSPHLKISRPYFPVRRSEAARCFLR